MSSIEYWRRRLPKGNATVFSKWPALQPTHTLRERGVMVYRRGAQPPISVLWPQFWLIAACCRL